MFTVAPARCLVMLSVVIGLACSASQTGSSQSRTSFYCNNNLPSQGIEEAFLRDNFTVVKNATFEGVRGFLAHSLNATVLKTGAPKPALYVEGNPYQTGFLTGFLMEQECSIICSTFLQRIPLQLVDDNFKHWNRTIMKELEKLVDFILTEVSVDVWDREVKAGNIPSWAVEQIQGIVDGAKVSNEKTKVTRDKLISINYGFDVITARVFSGKFLGLSQLARRAQLYRLENFFQSLDRDLHESEKHILPLLPPAYCDAMGVRGAWTSEGESAFFGRDYQMVTGDVLQDYISLIIYNPCNSSMLPMVSAAAPGFVGAFAGINIEGVAMGIDTIRSANSDAKNVGLNSLLLIRDVMSRSSNIQEVIEAMAEAPRGAPFLYPACDGSGDCAFMEAGRYLPRGQNENPLQYVDKKLLSLIPNASYLEQHAILPELYKNGMYVRFMNYTYDEGYLNFNPALFEYASYPYDADAFKAGNFLFPNFTADLNAQTILENNFFYPQKENDSDLIVMTNFALIPEMRITMMNKWSDKFAASGEAMFWRYDQLLHLLDQEKGKIDFEKAKWIMSFLSPDRTPGYWHDYLYPNNSMSAVVEGSLTVYDLKNRLIQSKSGYWADEWVGLSLQNYI